jgi:hypothetical protein
MSLTQCERELYESCMRVIILSSLNVLKYTKQRTSFPTIFFIFICLDAMIIKSYVSSISHKYLIILTWQVLHR